MSLGILLDTTILSKLTDRQGPPATLIDWLADVQTPFYISAINYYEVLAGLNEIKAVKTAEHFKVLLKNLSISILPVSAEIADLAALKRGEGKILGEQRKMADLLIGATATVHGLNVATANVKDFGCWDFDIVGPS